MYRWSSCPFPWPGHGGLWKYCASKVQYHYNMTVLYLSDYYSSLHEYILTAQTGAVRLVFKSEWCKVKNIFRGKTNDMQQFDKWLKENSSQVAAKKCLHWRL